LQKLAKNARKTAKMSESFNNVRAKTPEVRINARKHFNLRKQQYAVQFSLLLPPCGPFFLNLTAKTGPHDNKRAIIAEVSLKRPKYSQNE